MKTKLRQQLRARQRKIQRRLDKTKFPKRPGPVLAGGKLCYEISDRVHGLSYGGISLFHQLARDLGFSPIELGRIDEGGRLIQAQNALVLRPLIEQPRS